MICLVFVCTHFTLSFNLADLIKKSTILLGLLTDQCWLLVGWMAAFVSLMSLRVSLIHGFIGPLYPDPLVFALI